MLLKTVTIFATVLMQASCTEYGFRRTNHCEVRMRTDAGWVCGRIRYAENGAQYASFRGVPYATPPVGPLRFKELVPLNPWSSSTMLDATEDAPICLQDDCFYGNMLTHPRGFSEDCIYLNLHAPLKHLPTSRKYCRHLDPLPILVFIHGGAFQSGSGLSDTCGPDYLLMQKVILITFNYRLNVFGFLSLGSKEILGNQGLRDMVTLLRWVQRNARAFGGDPDNVTLMGQSSGGTAAQLLSLSLETKGLFNRCMFLSGYGFPSFFTVSPKYAEDTAKAYLKKLNITTTDPHEIHEILIRLPPGKLMKANTEFQYETEVVSFCPTVEPRKYHGITRILDDFPLTLIAKGRGKEYPTVLAFTNNEMGAYKSLLLRKGALPFLTSNPIQIVTPRLKYSLNANQLAITARKIYDRYFVQGLNLEDLTVYYADAYFKYAALKLAEWKQSIGGAPMFNFKFSYESEYSPIKEANWAEYTGAAHGDDITHIFRFNSMLDIRHRAFPPRTKDDVMKIWMVFLTVNFVANGNPASLMQRESWLKPNDTLRYCELREPLKLDIHELDHYEKDMVEFFDSIDYEVREISKRLKRVKELNN